MNRLLKLLKVVNSETDPLQISLALALAMVAGLTPLASLHNLVVLLLLLVLRVNIAAFLVGVLLFSAVAYVFDPAFHALGLALLQRPGLAELWTAMYDSTPWRLARFNNTLVLGSLAVSLALFVPAVLLFNFLIRRYREHLLAALRRTRLVQLLQANKLYQRYRSLSEFVEP